MCVANPGCVTAPDCINKGSMIPPTSECKDHYEAIRVEGDPGDYSNLQAHCASRGGLAVIMNDDDNEKAFRACEEAGAEGEDDGGKGTEGGAPRKEPGE